MGHLVILERERIALKRPQHTEKVTQGKAPVAKRRDKRVHEVVDEDVLCKARVVLFCLFFGIKKTSFGIRDAYDAQEPHNEEGVYLPVVGDGLSDVLGTLARRRLHLGEVGLLFHGGGPVRLCSPHQV